MADVGDSPPPTKKGRKLSNRGKGRTQVDVVVFLFFYFLQDELCL